MIKRIVHLLLAFMFPIYVLINLLVVVLFFEKGFGEKWFPDAEEMIDVLKRK